MCAISKPPAKPAVATSAKYIKLGAGGLWDQRCLREEGTLRFGYHEVPHDLVLEQDLEKLKQFFADRGGKGAAPANHARNVWDFYFAEPETLWITFSDGYLWWCFARPEVEYLLNEAGDPDPEGSRLRHTVDGWHNKSVGGKPLLMRDLNGALTSLASYQMTVCTVRPFDYLLRKINDEELPQVVEAQSCRDAMHDSIKSLMKLLTWKDFELLVDLIFSQSGWRRTGETGGSQKTVDIELELPSTGERAFVQVKSRTNEQQFDRYVEELAGRLEGRMFYAYHSGPANLACEEQSVTLLGPDELAAMVLDAGLFNWLLDKVD